VDVATGELVASFSTVDLERTPSWTDSAGICLSPEGSKLAMTTPSGCGVDIWEPRKAKLLYALPETDDTVHWLAWSPDSQRLAIARSNGNTEVWRLEEVEKVLAKLALSP
jgi:WD40 repeat protein